MVEQIQIGDRVVVEYDSMLDSEWPKRAAHDAQTGKVIARHDSHGLCFEVEFEGGASAHYEPSELTLVKED